MTLSDDDRALSNFQSCQVPTTRSQNLRAAVERYKRTAHVVNTRELSAFVASSRVQFEPCHPDERLEGYSVEGEFAAEVYRDVFQADFPTPMLSPGDELSLAEASKMVCNRDPASFVDDFPSPTTPPVNAELVAQEAEILQDGLRAQCSNTELELPSDWQALLSLTDGIMSVGLPYRTGFIYHVYPVWTRQDEHGRTRLDRHKAELCATPSQLSDAQRWSRYECLDIKAAFRIGGGAQENELRNATYRDTWYVYCRPISIASASKGGEQSDTGGPLVWRIIDRTDQFFESFVDLKDYVDYWAEYIENTPRAENWFAAV